MMDKIEKTYYQGRREYKLFGFVVFEIEGVSTTIEGPGAFISETSPCEGYYKQEFES